MARPRTRSDAAQSEPHRESLWNYYAVSKRLSFVHGIGELFKLRSPAFVLLVLAAMCGTGRADPRDLSLVVTPAFLGKAASGGQTPIFMEATNNGPDAVGSIILTWEGSSISYPIDLPSGARKRLMGYAPPEAHWMDAIAALETNQGDLQTPLQLPEPTGDHAIGLIGGSLGDLTFLRQEYPEMLNFADSYGRPGSLPDRPVGYSSFAALVLGEGAERMTDDEVRAIKTWAINGGTIVLPGGASSPILGDARWKDLLPVGAVKLRNVDGLPGIEKLGGSAMPAAQVSLAVGAPAKGSNVMFSAHGVPVVVQRGFGLGQVVYMAFDPFQPPIKQWKGLTKLFANGIGVRDGLFNRAASDSYQSELYEYGGMSENPFDAELPGAGTVFLILLLHFIIAVPVNFALLRKFGKGDLAWITTPIISVAFAGVFFGLAFGLYKSGQSARTQGTLVVSAEHDEGYFTGMSELFIPKGGRYDLGLEDVDNVASQPDDYYYGPNRFDTELQDDGEVRMRSLRASNLSFHEFWFSQRVEATKWLQGSIRKSGDLLVCSITNASPYGLRDVYVILGDIKYLLGDIAKGGTLELKAPGMPLSDPGRFRMGNAAIVRADMEGFRPGPQIGVDVGSKISLLYTWGKIQ